jgi:hypothetical protein
LLVFADLQAKTPKAGRRMRWQSKNSGVFMPVIGGRGSTDASSADNTSNRHWEAHFFVKKILLFHDFAKKARGTSWVIFRLF